MKRAFFLGCLALCFVAMLWATGDGIAEQQQYTLTVTKVGSGGGTVTSSPVGINCGSDCTESYSQGKKVALKARADPISYFVGWSGGACSGTKNCSVSMNSDLTVTAIFEPKAPAMSVSPISLDFGSVKLGKKVMKTLKIANNGTGDLIITISGTDGTDFSIRGSSNVTIKPKRTFTLNITFKPTPTGLKITTLKIGSNDTGRPVINIPLTGTDQTQSAVIGPEGGTVTGDSGTQAIIPPGATDGNLAAAISPVPQEYLKIDSSEGIEVLGAVYFYIGDKVLSNNSELVIPKPDNFSAGSEILLGKIIHLPDKDLVLMVDTAHIEGNSIKTGAPAFPGAIISGTYVFYQNNTSCGVPDYQAFFAGKINPTCTDKLYLYIYFRTEAPILITQIQNLSNYIDGALNSNDAAQSVISIADTMATLNGLSGKTAEELIADSEGEMSGFMGTLYGGYWDIGALWIPLITCPITGSCAQELAVTVAGMWFNAWAATQVIYLGEEINNILIAQKFFELYYGYGRSQPLVAQSLGLAPGAGLDGIVEAVAKTVVNDPWWWPFPSYDVTKIKNIISTGEQWIGSIYKAAQSPWLSFVEGNPGIPGDGVFIGATITSDYDPHSEDFRLSNLIPLTQFANGFTLTIFFRSDTQPSISGFCIESTKVPEPCFKGACGITCTSFTTFFNGTEGLSYSCSQSDIKNAIDLANFATELHPGCEYLPPYTIDDFYINGIDFIYLQQQATPGPITTLDAAIILPGQNAVP